MHAELHGVRARFQHRKDMACADGARSAASVAVMAVGWCVKSSYTVMPFTVPRTSSRALDVANAASAASACAGGTPAWRAAATIASALCILCSPASVQDASPWDVPAHDTSEAAGVGTKARRPTLGIVERSTGEKQPMASVSVSAGSAAFATINPEGGTMRTKRCSCCWMAARLGKTDIDVVVFEVIENGRVRGTNFERACRRTRCRTVGLDNEE